MLVSEEYLGTWQTFMVKFLQNLSTTELWLKVHANSNISKWISKSSCSEVSCKMVFLKISHNSQENTYVEASFLIMLQAFVVPLKDLWKF